MCLQASTVIVYAKVGGAEQQQAKLTADYTSVTPTATRNRGSTSLTYRMLPIVSAPSAQ
jgi:hypothetical protein